MRIGASYLHSSSFAALSLACLAVVSSFVWQGHMGLNFWDEGFLWYGAQRVMQGEVPLRDFMAYDPGRYYWTSTFMTLFGSDSIVSLRAAVAVFQTLGLFVGILLVARSLPKARTGNWLLLILVTVTLLIWMFPRHKLFDISLSILSIGMLTFLIEKPTLWRYFLVGMAMGVAAVFGRNHGLYGAFGSMGVMLWLCFQREAGPSFWRGFLLWMTGAALGFSPILLMGAMIPGFGMAFWETVRLLFEQQATNLPLPVPWPWSVDFLHSSAGEALRAFLVGIFFLGLLFFATLAPIWAALRRAQEKSIPAAFVASSFLALPYAHYAFSRADVGHLAHGIYPMLLGLFVLSANARGYLRWSVSVALCATSFWVMIMWHPGSQCRQIGQCETVDVSGSALLVPSSVAKEIALSRQMDATYAGNGENILITPYWPGIYALLGKKAPMWEIYALVPRTAQFETKEIERIQKAKPAFALVLDMPLDGQENLRFQNTHPLVNQYIKDHFERLPETFNPDLTAYKAQGAW